MWGGIIAIVIVGMVLRTIAEIAKQIARRGAADKDLLRLQGDVDALSDDLEELHEAAAGQATTIAELQERLDFAERLLAQARERPSLGAGQPPQ